eukprot:357516-Chlamydomonas_euryale.AAC.23
MQFAGRPCVDALQHLFNGQRQPFALGPAAGQIQMVESMCHVQVVESMLDAGSCTRGMYTGRKCGASLQCHSTELSSVSSGMGRLYTMRPHAPRAHTASSSGGGSSGSSAAPPRCPTVSELNSWPALRAAPATPPRATNGRHAVTCARASAAAAVVPSHRDAESRSGRLRLLPGGSSVAGVSGGPLPCGRVVNPAPHPDPSAHAAG